MHSEPLPAPPLSLNGPAQALREAVIHARRVLLTGPMGPDGDSIGACLALAGAIRALSRAQVDIAGEPSYRYAWMPGAAQMIPDDQIKPDYDLVIVLDGDRGRLEKPVDAAFRAAARTGIIDHHRSTTPDGYDLVLIDHQAASTCDLVFGLMQQWAVPVDADAARLLYTGLIFDTGGFRHSNTTPDTHRLAAELLSHGIDHPRISTRVLMERSRAGLMLLGSVVSEATFLAGGQVAVGAASYALGTRLGAGPGDLEGIVDHLLYTVDVELACLFIERAPGRVKLSLRSRSRVDVAALARQICPGGGGHARASGAHLDEPLDRAMERVLPLLIAAVEPGAE